MAYLFADGFDNYNSILQVWDATSGAPAFQNSGPAPRFPNPSGCASQYIQLTGTKSCTKNLSSNSTTLIAGVAFYMTSLPGSIGTAFGFLDSGSTQVGVTINNTGTMQFIRGQVGGGTSIGPTTPLNTFAPNVWYEVAIVVTISTTVGQVTAYLNGNSTPIITSAANLNTQATGNNTANQFYVGTFGSGGFPTSNFDDVYVYDSTTGINNAWPGNDVRILTKLPTGAGTYTNWTPNGLGTNWQCVSQNPANTSDYVANNTPGTKDSYAMTATGLAVAPYAVVVRQSVEKDDGNAHTAQALMRSSGVDGTGTAYNVNSSYTFVDTLFPNDPNTSSPWTASAADAAQIGIVETS